MHGKIFSRSFFALSIALSFTFLAGLGFTRDASKKPYSNQKLFRLGQQKSFKGPYLREIAFPLGGIGTGIP